MQRLLVAVGQPVDEVEMMVMVVMVVVVVVVMMMMTC